MNLFEPQTAAPGNGDPEPDPPTVPATPTDAIAGSVATADSHAWLAVGAGTLGAFMALLDVSIVNASLPVIQGEIGLTPSEATWVNTGYLVAEIIVIPLTPWLERLLGLRLMLTLAGMMFTIFSMVCGFSESLATMVIGRLGQGFSGGTMIPVALTIMAKRLPPQQQAIGIAIFGLTAFLAPIGGPVIGGWVTEAWSWRYAFLINVPLGLVLMLLVRFSMPRSAVDWNELRNADWLGIAGIAIGLGCLTVLLEQGHRQEWFESSQIRSLAVGAALGIAMLATSQWRRDTPVLRLALLRKPALMANIALVFVVCGLLFPILFLVPQFLAAIAGYNALQAGGVIFWVGVTATVASMLYPVLVTRVDIRLLVGVSILTVAIGSLLAARMTAQSVGSDFTLPLLLAGFGASLATVPLQQAAVSSVAVEYSGDISAIYNVSRNIGAAITLAIIASFQESRFDLHLWRLQATISANDIDLQQGLQSTASLIDGGAGASAIYRGIEQQVSLEALVMTFNDIFFAMGVASLAILPLVLFLRPVAPDAMAAGLTH